MNLFGRSKAVKGGKEGGKEWNISIFWAGSCVSLWDEKCGKKFNYFKIKMARVSFQSQGYKIGFFLVLSPFNLKNNAPTECTKLTKGRKLLHSDVG